MAPRSALRGSRKGFMDLYIHTRDAIRTRCQHELTEAEFRDMGKRIRNKEAQFVLKQSGSRVIYRLQTPYGVIYPVYNKNLSEVCTVLEEYMVEQQLRKHRPMEA